MNVRISRLQSLEQMSKWKDAFESHNFYRPDDYYHTCLQENNDEIRITYLALVDDEIAGCCHLKLKSEYPSFLEAGT